MPEHPAAFGRLARWLAARLPHSAPHFETVEALLEWATPARSAAEVKRAIAKLPYSHLRERAALEISCQQREWSPALVRALWRWEPTSGFNLAENPSFRGRAVVKALLDECVLVGTSYHPEHPLGPYPDWENHRIAMAVIRAGKLDFPHIITKSARKAVRKNIYDSVSYSIVCSDPHSPDALLEQLGGRLEGKRTHHPKVQLNRLLVLERLATTARWPERRLGLWRTLMEDHPERASDLLQHEGLRSALTPEDLLPLLQHPSEAVRLAAIRAVAEILPREQRVAVAEAGVLVADSGAAPSVDTEGRTGPELSELSELPESEGAVQDTSRTPATLATNPAHVARSPAEGRHPRGSPAGSTPGRAPATGSNAAPGSAPDRAPSRVPGRSPARATPSQPRRGR
jgi:hypothetical protein